MNSQFSLKFYQSFVTCNSAQATFCCNLQDGGILIAQGVENGIIYIIYKDGKERVLKVSLDERDMICIGIIGFTIKDTESLVLLMKFKTVNLHPGREYCLKVVTFKSVSTLTEESVALNNQKVSVGFTPTYIKGITVPSCQDTNGYCFILLGNIDGSVTAYDFKDNPLHSPTNPAKTRYPREIRRSKYFADFFPKASSPLMCVDFIEITETKRVWAFGFRNGYVCVYYISDVKFDDNRRIKYILYEFNPLQKQDARKEAKIDRSQNAHRRSEGSKKGDDIRKYVFATHLSSPIVAVKLLLPFGLPSTNNFPVVDLMATCYDNKIVRYENVVEKTLINPTPFADLSNVLCANCLYCDAFNPKLFLCGDLSNYVHVFQQSEDNPRYYDKKESIRVNDSVYHIQVMQSNVLVVVTRQGVYLLSFPLSNKQSHYIVVKCNISSVQSVVPAMIVDCSMFKSTLYDR